MSRDRLRSIAFGALTGLFVVALAVAIGGFPFLGEPGDQIVDGDGGPEASRADATTTPEASEGDAGPPSGPPTLRVEFDVRGEHIAITEARSRASSDLEVMFTQPFAGISEVLTAGTVPAEIQLVPGPFAVMSELQEATSPEQPGGSGGTSHLYGGYMVTFDRGCGTARQPIVAERGMAYRCGVTLVPWAAVRITHRITGGDLGVEDFKVEIEQPEEERVRSSFGNFAMDLGPHQGPWEVRRGPEPSRSTIGYDFELEGDCSGDPTPGVVFECTVIRTVNDQFEPIRLPTWTAEPASTPIPTVERTTAEVITDGLRLRSGASVDHPIVRVLDRGERLDVVGRHPNREWLAIENEGWVFYSPGWLALDVGLLELPAVVTASSDADVSESAPTRRWGFDTFSLRPGVGAAAADGVVYGGSRALWAIDAASGSMRWKFIPDRTLTTTPAIDGFFVYAGSFDGTLYAISIATGRERWRFQTGGQIDSAPIVLDGLVYVGSRDHRVYALDAESGAEVWSFEALDYVILPLSADRGAVYVASADHVYALDAATGQELWRYQERSHLETGVVSGDGAIYFGATDHHLHAIDVETRDRLWRFETGSQWFAEPQLVDGMLYFGGEDSFAYAVVAATGEEHWRHAMPSWVRAGPVATAETLYVAGLQGELHAVDLATGLTRWQLDAGSFMSAPPVLHDGLLIYSIEEGWFTALELP